MAYIIAWSNPACTSSLTRSLLDGGTTYGVDTLNPGVYPKLLGGYFSSVGGPVPVASELKGGTTGTAYSETISAQGGTGPYTFAITSGALPAGLSLSTSGTISGTPTATGTSTFTVTVTDSGGATGSQPFSITINAPTTGGGAASSIFGYTA